MALKLGIAAALVLVTSSVLAQSGNPAGNATAPHASNPSGSGTSTSGGRDANGDRGRDRMGTTGLSADQARKRDAGTSSAPAQPNMTGEQKAGTNAEGTAKSLPHGGRT